MISPTIVPERIPVHDDNDYDDADDIHEARDHSSTTPHPSDPEGHDDDDDDDSLPRASTHLKNIVVVETSPEAPKPLQIPPSPSSGIALSNDSRIFPARLSISSPSQPELPSPNTEYMGWEDSLRVIVTDATPKKNGEGSQSTWGRVKNAFSRPGSSTGKRPRNDSIQERGNNANSNTLRTNGTRSRNNSIRDRATNTDSSTSRESGASLTGASKTDKGK
jgi:serine/arginine repetitive matrix protein 2